MRTLRCLLWLCTSLLITGCLHSEVPSAKPVGCVWRVESPTNHIYLCGTIHLLRSADYPLAASYEEAYKDSQRLMFELPPGSGTGLASIMTEAARTTDGKTLFDMVDAETAKAFRGWAEKRGINADGLSPFKPWFAAITIAAAEYQAAGAEANRGVDTFFEQKAARDGKPGSGLETVKSQIDLFANLTNEQQAELLKQTLAEVEKLGDMFDEMVTSWKKGDVDSLTKMLFDEAEKHPELMEVFIHKRNQAWIPALEAALAGKERIMVLVGSGHLGGEGGVVKLLEKKGYKVNQLGVTVGQQAPRGQ
ncbi:MAG: TraB/GumN family protein [Verrucomicrobiaceae bacterium]|nr:TraB/GumN family protein [Verrucomicrobiaceae bacterium]